ncbi:hypothetical protein QW060_15160 [Myroides ceti]|uniref:Uncharacterized protein n=1 Tax=Paenimyroides ceti TaxID=395087 RepID=A0ABT8CVA0_9FLAO|nr:hypothetical protein [Paenimyroides ceti]MDN3708439.1 hypothetical protein [Paenimyroides ceti]
MKTTIFTSLGMLLTLAAQAQTNSSNVTLNVRLNPIQTLVVNPSAEHKTVNLDYITEADYANGVSQARENHLTVYSTGGFQVKVNSAGSALENQNGAGANGHIQANTIQIVPSAGSSAINGAQYTSQSLANEQKTIVSSTTGGVDKTFNIQYKGAGAETYLNYYVAGQNPTVYTTQVTYTIVAQ